ncbi:hypothetical protein CP985_08430 [Malaciobacter mytili LMG 24559]|uniref:Replication initiation protein n=1 Tax=Malaciobacter mytili LMG 24559 TaxID=1032238 RepID=A0AAX2AHQ8_9BACT|nr:replication initiation protein [Malaciobacter mytili]AXH16507.1 replication initiation protein [Malaciobacter mytili LMG 24559]RXK15463.1 hypothetical protein CP985_08430 [Malaciobacter mytili LMG 24559]
MSGNNNLDINSKSQIGEIRFPRSQAQADYKIEKKKVVRRDGTVFYKKTTTTNDEKIADACVQIFQQSSLAKEFDYDNLRENAIKNLLPRFNKYKLIVTDDVTKKEKDKIEEKQEIAIAQYIRDYIEKNIDLTFQIDFDKFIKMTGIKSAERIGNALNMLDEVQSKASYEYKLPVINEDFSQITYELTKVSTIPRISLILDEDMGKKYNTISEYAQSDIKNKRKHILGIKFDINKSYLSSVLGLGRDYTATNRKDRNNFTSSYSYRLDILIKSIEKVQHISKFNYFTFEQIQKKFGTQFKEYRDFKRRVLLPSIKDINEYTYLNIELIEHRQNNAKNREVEGISFRITKKISIDKKTKFGVDKTAYYIASRLFYFTNEKIDNLLGFAKHIEKTFNSLDIVLYDGKYINEWKDEADKAVEAEAELIKILEDNNRLFIQKGIEYDEKRMCIVQKEIIQNEEGVPASKIKIITTSNYRVENPITSLIYIKELTDREGESSYSILDFLPFSIALSDGWKNIDNVEDYIRFKKNIIEILIEKRINHIKVENKEIQELLYTNIVRENIKEINDKYREIIKSLVK